MDKHIFLKKQIAFIKQRLHRVIGIISKLQYCTDIIYLFFYEFIIYFSIHIVIYGILNWSCAHKHL